MKKNKMMRVASALLVAVLMTTSVISGTFAKYVTTDSASDEARVAKWGVTVLVSGNLFGKNYAENAAQDNADSIVASSNNVSASDKNVVAPGTKNETGLLIEIAGTPEVAYTIATDNNNITVEDIFLDKGTWGVMVQALGLNAATDVTKYYTRDNGTYTKVAQGSSWESTTTYYELIDEVIVTEKYYPIDWTVTSTGNATAIATTKDLTTISESIFTGIKAGSHNANESSYASYTLTWEWDYEDNNITYKDGADTILGNLMASNMAGIFNGTVVKLNDDNTTYTHTLTVGTDYNLDVKFGISVTVTQAN